MYATINRRQDVARRDDGGAGPRSDDFGSGECPANAARRPRGHDGARVWDTPRQITGRLRGGGLRALPGRVAGHARRSRYAGVQQFEMLGTATARQGRLLPTARQSVRVVRPAPRRRPGELVLDARPHLICMGPRRGAGLPAVRGHERYSAKRKRESYCIVARAVPAREGPDEAVGSVGVVTSFSKAEGQTRDCGCRPPRRRPAHTRRIEATSSRYGWRRVPRVRATT